MVLLLVVLAALDAGQLLYAPAQGAGASGTTSEPAWWWWTMFVVNTPGHESAIGMFDLLLIGTLAEHARRRGLGLVTAIAPGFVGLALADLASALSGGIGLPVVPFLLGGWLITEGWLTTAGSLAPTTKRPTS